MPQPFMISIPHRLGKEEAVRRLKAGLGGVRVHFASVLAVQEEVWSGDCLRFRVAALGQSASGTIDVEEDHVRLEVELPWLLGQFAQTIAPVIRAQGTRLLDKK